MTSINAFAVSTPFGIHRYTVQQWEVLRPFVEGTQQDPKQFFYLADDIWELWPYALNGTSTLAGKYRAKFSNLYSFIKPFVKWYCYQQILQRPGDLREYQVKLSYSLKMSDEYLLNHEYITLDDLTFPVFEDLWVSLLPQKDTPFIQKDVRFQWRHEHFGFKCTTCLVYLYSYHQLLRREDSLHTNWARREFCHP